MLRLAVVTTYFPYPNQPHRGRTAYQTLRRLRDRMDIEVFCPVTVYPRWFGPKTFLESRVEPAFSDSDVPVRYLNYGGLPGLSRPFNGRRSAQLILPHLRRFQPDVILSYTLYPEGYAAMKAAKRLNVPAILCAIGSDVRRIPDPVTRWLTRTAVREASMVMAVSEDLRSQVVGLGAHPDRTRTVLNGVDPRVYRPRDRGVARTRLGVPLHDPLVVFAGNLIPAKGVHEFVEAVIQLRYSQPTLRAVLLGDGVSAPDLRARIAAEGLTDSVLLPGACASEQVAAWMAAADIFCLPSYSEGCPNVVLEALACGRPVVASDVGGIPELINPGNGILVPPRSSILLAQALDQALGRQWDETRISRSFSRNWDDVADEVYSICLAATGSSSRVQSTTAH